MVNCKMKKIKVAVLFGGRSGEHEVSLVSAASVMKALNPDKYEIIKVGITKHGNWIINAEIDQMAKFDNDTQTSDIKLNELVALKPDVVFPVLHGTFCEDGTLQGMLETIDLPYVGCGVMASAICMDKTVAKRLFKEAGINIVPYLEIKRNEFKSNKDEILKEIESKLGYPCFVKPVNSGSSVGITKAKNESDLEMAINEAAKYDRKILIEKAISGREIEVSVLGNDSPKASLPGEIVPCNEFYDYSAKYIDDKSGLNIPAELSDEIREKIRENAVTAYKAADCAGMARVDFFLERNTNKIYLNEINTIPGFTSISMYPKLWEATGLSYSSLLDELIELAMERFNDKQISLSGIEALNNKF